jgi:hypothetical protein
MLRHTDVAYRVFIFNFRPFFTFLDRTCLPNSNGSAMRTFPNMFNEMSICAQNNPGIQTTQHAHKITGIHAS